MKAKTHTPLPWSLVDQSAVGSFRSRHIDISPDPDAVIYRPIAMLTWNEVDEERGDHPIQKENAKFIVKACNHHYALLMSLQDLCDALVKDGRFAESVESNLEHALDILELVGEADAFDQGDEALSELREDPP